MKITKKKIIAIIISIACIFVSIFIVEPITTSTEFHETSITSLNEKQSTVLKMTTAVAVTSTLMAVVPGDATTPVANTLANMSTSLLIILATIYLEKILLTLTGYLAFKFLIPIACIIFIVYLFIKKESIMKLALKLALFGIVIFLAIPISVQVSTLIEETYKASINETIETALIDAEGKGISIESIQKEAEELESSTSDSTSENTGSSTSLWNRIKSGASNAVSKIKNAVSDAASSVSDGVANTISNIENTFNRCLESLAILIITNCVIPLLVWTFFIWFIKVIFSISLPNYTSVYRNAKKARQEMVSALSTRDNNSNK